MNKKILMLGWELPPHNSGGLGVACLNLARSLSRKGSSITFVLPNKVDVNYDFINIVFANIKLDKHLQNAYGSAWQSEKLIKLSSPPSDFVKASLQYAKRVKDLVSKMDIDLIHSHDWLTIPAGVMAKAICQKPLVVHIHSTEHDRTGGNNYNQQVYEIEKQGFKAADKIISVSNLTKNTISERYSIPSEKIEVVYNGAESQTKQNLPPTLQPLKDLGYKFVLFLGRITLQKGPEYFVKAAQIVTRFHKKVIFIVVGSGDMQEKMMNLAIQENIMDKMMFTGFLRGNDKERIYQAADVYVMPSVSEPFGITSLEAIANETPVIVSKQSGVSEILRNVLKVDFWDTEEIANQIISVLDYRSLTKDLTSLSKQELQSINWDNSADKCIQIYNQLIK
jgi:glycosyltransferase involved in cell wall biosynthesis